MFTNDSKLTLTEQPNGSSTRPEPSAAACQPPTPLKELGPRSTQRTSRSKRNKQRDTSCITPSPRRELRDKINQAEKEFRANNEMSGGGWTKVPVSSKSYIQNYGCVAIPDRLYFGSYPRQSDIDEMERQGFVMFIDLTDSGDSRKITPYKTTKRYVNFPIKDISVPKYESSFARFILLMCNELTELKRGEKIFFSCVGGHGRSGIVCAALLTQYKNLEPNDALDLTNDIHSKRLIMKDRWRRIGSPQTSEQKEFVKSLFFPINVDLNRTINFRVKGYGSFSSIYEAFDRISASTSKAHKWIWIGIFKACIAQNTDFKVWLIKTGLHRLQCYYTSTNITESCSSSSSQDGDNTTRSTSNRDIKNRVLTDIRNQLIINSLV